MSEEEKIARIKIVVGFYVLLMLLVFSMLYIFLARRAQGIEIEQKIIREHIQRQQRIPVFISERKIWC